MANAARLRVGNCLSRPFLVSLGLLEGSILSPLLFVIVFSFVWDFLKPNEFPDPDSPPTLDLNGLWILAFADDLVILSPSRSRLAEALRKIDSELALFNLQMSLQKTETMTFTPRRPSFDPPDSIVIRSSALAQVDSFNYLGLRISPTGSLYDHLIAISHKAKVSVSLTVNLLHQLAINDVARIKTYFLSFVLAQFHGLELLPPSALEHIETIRSSFLRQLFRLPPGTPSDLFYVIFPAFSPAILCLQRRLAFFRRSLRHDLPCVSASFIMDATTNYNISCGWMYESFLIYRSLYPHVNPANFDFSRDVTDLMSQAVNEENFSFVFIQKSKMVCMSFFQKLKSRVSVSTFRTALSTLPSSYQHVLLCFFTNQTRWTFLSPPSRLCPLCFVESWYWEHFYTCSVINPLLVTRGHSLSHILFLVSAESPNWMQIFRDVACVHLSWYFALKSLDSQRQSLQYDPDVFRTMIRLCS
jgi:hypothetical protein